MPTPFLVALQFLTTIPVYLNVPPEPRDWGASLNWYGVVGLVIGALLMLAAWVFDHFLAPMVAAALVLVLWVLLTGALHLDGLGDSADGCMGSSRERAFEIMRDSRAGSMAVSAIALVLLVKFAALSTLIGRGEWLALLAAPLLARAGVQALFLTTPYARESGIGSSMVEHIERDRLLIMLIGALVIGAILVGISAWLVLPLLVLVFALLRRYMMRKLLGTTGDCAGALVEILEASALALMV